MEFRAGRLFAPPCSSFCDDFRSGPALFDERGSSAVFVNSASSSTAMMATLGLQRRLTRMTSRSSETRSRNVADFSRNAAHEVSTIVIRLSPKPRFSSLIGMVNGYREVHRTWLAWIALRCGSGDPRPRPHRTRDRSAENPPRPPRQNFQETIAAHYRPRNVYTAITSREWVCRVAKVGRGARVRAAKCWKSRLLTGPRRKLGTTCPRLLQFIRDSIPTQHCSGTTKLGGARLTRMKE